MAPQKAPKNRSLKEIVNLWVIICLTFFVSFNLFFLVSIPTDILQAKLLTVSLSKGDSYVGKLRLWKIYVLHNDWQHANQLVGQLDAADTAYYRSLYSPQSLQTQLNSLEYKGTKTVDDYVTMAQIYFRLGNIPAARQALFQAQKLDPIRDDIPALLSSLN